MHRVAVLFFLWIALAAPAAAQTAEDGQMRLYIQQLEERVRQLTGQNEQLTYEVNQLRDQLGQPPVAALPAQGGAAAAQPAANGSAAPVPGTEVPLGAPAQDPGTFSIAQDDPLISPDGAGAEGPVDLSVFAGGTSGAAADPNAGLAPVVPGAPVAPAPAGQQVAGLPAAAPSAPLTGSARDEYDLAYGYILTGDYPLAEQGFQNWLAAFPGEAQAADARFWLAESHLQQGEYREAANAFLDVYQTARDSPKGPDALMKLGVSLSALGERPAACSTFAEVGRQYPNASAALMSRVGEEAKNAGC